MEPPEETRRWVGELVGITADEHLARSGEAWTTLGPALTAVHEALVSAETEPAVQMLFPAVEEPPSGKSLGQQ